MEIQPDLKGVTYESGENCCFIGLIFTTQVFVDLIFLNITASKRTPRGAVIPTNADKVEEETHNVHNYVKEISPNSRNAGLILRAHEYN